MFSVGEIIVYGSQGVCRISEIVEMRISDDIRSYYILNPINDSKSTIYVPIDNIQMVSQMRAVLTREAIDEIIEGISKEEPLWIANNNERKEFCSNVIRNGNCKELMRLISMLYIHKENQINNKKRLQIADDRYLKEAEKQINDEFSYVLGISQNEVIIYIKNKIKNDMLDVSRKN